MFYWPSSLSGALITATNVALPVVLKTSEYGRYGPLFSLLYLESWVTPSFAIDFWTFALSYIVA